MLFLFLLSCFVCLVAGFWCLTWNCLGIKSWDVAPAGHACCGVCKVMILTGEHRIVYRDKVSNQLSDEKRIHIACVSGLPPGTRHDALRWTLKLLTQKVWAVSILLDMIVQGQVVTERKLCFWCIMVVKIPQIWSLKSTRSPEFDKTTLFTHFCKHVLPESLSFMFRLSNGDQAESHKDDR